MDIVELESDYLLMYVLVTLINRLTNTNIDKSGIENSRENKLNSKL
jgi:hypothetical protein